ncbi:DNA-directed RNA polymerase subunit beta' [bacterium]|nr:DNA-directed RNA polymerase subunit beta' [bacterium]
MFDAIRISLASPKVIRDWSRGEVKKPETINYRTFKPERDGLFCERIFGPVKDWECACGKYKRIRYKGVVCDRCGVEVTQSKVRRERLGHIELVAPVTHIWYFKGVPSRIAYLLNIGARALEKVIYYESYIVTDPGDTPLAKRQMLSDEDYRGFREQYGNAFKAKMGAEAIRDLLREIDLVEMSEKFHKDMETSSLQKKKEIVKRLKVVEAFRKSGNKPEWMVLEVVPVIPPELRPLVPLDGGRFATSDLNDLYRRVINRNNRLKKLMDLKAPDVIIRNEKRMLQEAVDALFDNGRRGHAVKGPGNRPLKSLSDMLKGKQGRFRQNLLGKRVDYSGRSVIVVGPELKLWQCGLPKKMALELFKPFIIKKLEERGYVHTIKSAKKMVERVKPEVWDILEEVLKDHPVMLNRAPTLHRQGIQAFLPVLVEGKALRIHPLVCAAFNADFDGDQMAVHVPLSTEAQLEARVLMLSTNNILSTSSGRPIISPSQDIVLGCYYLTKERPGIQGEGTIFSSPEEVMVALDAKAIPIHAKIKVRVNGELLEITAGRVYFNENVVPEKIRYVNKALTKKELTNLVAHSYKELGTYETVIMLDKMKEIGFEAATRAGITVSMDDILIPGDKPELIAQAKKEVAAIERQYQQGVITDGERYNKVIDIWTHTTDNIAEVMMGGLLEDRTGFNPIYMMADSGARGSKMQIRQLAGMRGLMAKPQQKITGAAGEIIESPIIANFREGLNVLEYFISTHGARKGLADTALKTADAGYLTRRLVDVAQDVIVSEHDCGTLNGISIGAIREGSEVIEPLKERILGRVALDNVVDLLSDEVLVRSGQEITEEIAEKIENAVVERIRIRSVLTCESRRGVCEKCYGRNLSTGKTVEVGEAVGIIAAQSIGEPGTQLTLRTFHIGGTASRVLEISKIEAKNDGVVRLHNARTIKDFEKNNLVLNRNAELGVYDERGSERELYPLPYGTVLKVSEGDPVKKGDVIALWDLYNVPIFTEYSGKVEFEDVVEGKTMKEQTDEATGLIGRVIVDHKEEDMHPQIVIRDDKNKAIGSYAIPTGAYFTVENGDTITSGTILAKIPREISKTRDITGGLPRVAELFEARKPKGAAVISEIDGTVSFGVGTVRGMRRCLVKHETGIEKEYLIPVGKHLNVRDSDRVHAGEALTDGPINPHDILEIKGENEVQEYLVNKVQEVYRLQGVTINDKHIEVIVRQLLRKVVVEDAGDTKFLVGTQVYRFTFRDENERVSKEGGRPATARPILLGITKASLGTESFISAASFQETTRVLTEAAIAGKVDQLSGLKENVIMGHLISAGTGMPHLQKLRAELEGKDKEEEEKVSEEVEVSAN